MKLGNDHNDYELFKSNDNPEEMEILKLDKAAHLEDEYIETSVQHFMPKLRLNCNRGRIELAIILMRALWIAKCQNGLFFHKRAIIRHRH